MLHAPPSQSCLDLDIYKLLRHCRSAKLREKKALKVNPASMELPLTCCRIEQHGHSGSQADGYVNNILTVSELLLCAVVTVCSFPTLPAYVGKVVECCRVVNDFALEILC